MCVYQASLCRFQTGSDVVCSPGSSPQEPEAPWYVSVPVELTGNSAGHTSNQGLTPQPVKGGGAGESGSQYTDGDSG